MEAPGLIGAVRGGASPALGRARAFMAAAGPAERRVALVIGNGAYDHATALLNPCNDALGIAERLSEAGFDQIIEHQDLGFEAMRRTIQAFGRTADGADIAVVYYAGHGI